MRAAQARQKVREERKNITHTPITPKRVLTATLSGLEAYGKVVDRLDKEAYLDLGFVKTPSWYDARQAVIDKTRLLPGNAKHWGPIAADLLIPNVADLALGSGKAVTIGKKSLKKSLNKLDDLKPPPPPSLSLAGVTDGIKDGVIKNGKNGSNGKKIINGAKPLQITVDPKYREIGPGFTQLPDIQKHLQTQNLKIAKESDTSLINRIISTPPDKIDPSVRVYGRDKFKHALYDLHHMDPKGETGAIFKLMREIGDEEDVVNLYAYMALRGVGGGDKMSNLLYMNKPAHWDLHKWRRNQPGLSGLKMEVGSNKLYNYLKETVDGDTNKLMKIVDEMIGDNFIVSRSKALEFQKNFVDQFNKNKLKLVSPTKNVRPIKHRSDFPSVEELYESIPSHYFDKGMKV